MASLITELPNKKLRACEHAISSDTCNAIENVLPPFDYAALYAASGIAAESSSFAEDKDLCNLGAPAIPGSKSKPCTKFFSTSGCPYGECCHFLHFVPGGIAALGMQVPTTNPIMGKQQLTHNGITTIVNDPSLTVNGYKTRLCNRFNTPEGCRFGDNCHFAHGEGDLRRPAPSSFLKPMYQATGTSTCFNAYNSTALPVQSDPSGGYVVSTTAINYNADGSYNAVATAAGAYAPPYSNPAYPTCTNTYSYPPNTAYPASTPYPATNYPSSTAAYPSSVDGYSNYPPSYTASYTAIDPASQPVNCTYYAEPTPPGVTVPSTPPAITMPTAGYEAALTA